jgi:CrcB protein
MKQLVWVCLGGALGSGARYLVSIWSLARFGPAFPYGTLAVNVVGSLLLAVLWALSQRATWISPTVQLALGAGVMGGFTTYSTFNLEILRHVGNGQARAAVIYGVATLASCLAAGFVGMYLVRLLAGK